MTISAHRKGRDRAVLRRRRLDCAGGVGGSGGVAGSVGEAVAVTQRTDSPVFQADAFSELGEVLEAAGRREEAIAAWREALARYERKEILPLARRIRERLAELQPAQR